MAGEGVMRAALRKSSSIFWCEPSCIRQLFNEDSAFFFFSCIMGLFLEMTPLAQDVLPSQNTFGSYEHFSACFAVIFPRYPLHRCFGSPWHMETSGCTAGRRKREDWQPQDRDQAQFGLSLATFHLGQPIVLLWCVECNCFSLNIRLDCWELVQGEPFGLSWG